MLKTLLFAAVLGVAALACAAEPSILPTATPVIADLPAVPGFYEVVYSCAIDGNAIDAGQRVMLTGEQVANTACQLREVQ